MIFNTYAHYLKYYYKDIGYLGKYARNDYIFAPQNPYKVLNMWYL